MAKRHMMLLFGSFNPVHRGHTALAEYAIERGLCDAVAMIISPQNPFKQNMTLASEMDRYAMVEAACKATRYPEQIHASVVEFLLEKPSYTINTLRYLEENNGHEMRFSILMGSDLINTLKEWREAEEIIRGYDIYVYPRPNVEMTYKTPRTTFLADAPQCDYSSTASSKQSFTTTKSNSVAFDNSNSAFAIRFSMVSALSVPRPMSRSRRASTEGALMKIEQARSPKIRLRLMPPITSTSKMMTLPFAQMRSISLRNVP